jgi:hypothetical protein
MKKSIVLGLTATLLTFGPLVAGVKPKAAEPVASQAMQKQQPAKVTQSTTKMTKSSTAMNSNRIYKLSGTVDRVNSTQLMITTKSGNKDTFALESSTKNVSKAKVGDRVTVWYRESNGRKMATRLAVNHSSAARKMSRQTTTSAANNSKAKTQHSAMTSQH